ncbi:hypothetical protein Dda_3056 [Drechslerella dactyloides]|uniref:Uncharacterized protein n=1 Tax=Drechslerella dactyloides TaxID=74499 RepID=A0AAD6J174_DREDA|nr:hypothetical protein Dda_3056 [Drechslerella dactyloides]
MTPPMSSAAAALVAAAGRPPRECDPTSTDPAQYVREKHVAHFKWVWWSSPYCFVTDTGAKLNYHDVYRYRVKHGRIPEGLDQGVYARWMADKKAVLKVFPPGPFNIAPKGAPSQAEAPDRWVQQAASSQEASKTSPAIARILGGETSRGPGGPLSTNASSARLAGADNQKVSRSKVDAASSAAAPPDVAAAAAPPAQGLGGPVAIAGQQSRPRKEGAQSGPAEADGSAAQLVQVATLVPAPAPAAVQQQQTSVPPVITAVASAPVVQSGAPTTSAPPAAPNNSNPGTAPSVLPATTVQMGPAVGAPQVPAAVPASTGTQPVATGASVVASNPMDVTYTGAPVAALAGPPLAPQVPQQALTQSQASAGLAANPHPSAALPTTPILQVPTPDAATAASLRQWIVATTGRSDQRVVHSIVPSEASSLREEWNTEVYHVFWPHEYLCLFFPDSNEAVEFFTEGEMWEDAPRDATGDVIMGRMCDVSWMGCCACRAFPGGYCD